MTPRDEAIRRLVEVLHRNVDRADDEAAIDTILALLDTPSPDREALEACDVCGSKRVLIRGRHPHDPERPVCPTCATERLERIREMATPPQPAQSTTPRAALTPTPKEDHE